MQNRSLSDWIIIFGKYANIFNPEDFYNCASTSMAELILSGCTTAVDHHWLFPDDNSFPVDQSIMAASEIGIRYHPVRSSITNTNKSVSIAPYNLIEKLDIVL